MAADCASSLEQASLLSTEPEAAGASKVSTWKRVGIAVLASFALLAAAWASSGVSLRGRQDRDDGEVRYGMPVEVSGVDDTTGEFSEMYSPSLSSQTQAKRCILCNPNQCTLDYSGKGAWTSCPVHAPYFSEAHCKCMSNCHDQSTPTKSTCSLCQDCSKKSCLIEGRYLQCAPRTPYFEPNKKLCTSSCQPPPGPTPPPYRPSPVQPAYSPTPMPMPYPMPQYSPTPMPQYSPTPMPQYSPKPMPTPTPAVVPTPTVPTPSVKCNPDTGGTCSWSSCSSSRGKTKCASGKCLCAVGYCSDKGKCVKYSKYAEQHQPTNNQPPPSSKCTVDTGSSCRWADCDSKIGHTKCDSLSAGKGSYKCLCKSHYCYDKVTKKCQKLK